MAYLPPKEEDREETQRDLQPMSTNSIGNIGSVQNPQTRKPSESGSWTNIQKYIETNQPQTMEMANKIGGNITGLIDKGESELTSSKDEFGGQVKSGTVENDPDLVIKGSSPGTVLSVTPEEEKKLGGILNAGYTGPTDIIASSGYKSASEDIGHGVENINRMGSTEGVYKNLQEYFGRPTYTPGQQSLDSSLLNMSPESKQYFSKMKEDYSGKGKDLAEAAKWGTEQVGAATGTTENTRTSSQAAFKKALDDFNINMTKKAQDEQARQQQEMQKYRELFGNKSMSAEDLQKLGIPLSVGQNTYGLDFNNLGYFSESMPIDVNTVSTPEEDAQYAALSKIYGQDNTFLNPANQTQTYDPSNLVNFNKDMFNTDYSGKQGAYNTTISNIQNQINSNSNGGAIAPQVYNTATEAIKGGADPMRVAMWAGRYPNNERPDMLDYYLNAPDTALPYTAADMNHPYFQGWGQLANEIRTTGSETFSPNYRT